MCQVPSSLYTGYPSITNDVHECVLEARTSVCETINEARKQLKDLRRICYIAARKSNVLLCGGGVHPFSDTKYQPIFDCPRYNRLRRERGKNWERAVVFGLHIHVGIADESMLFSVLNALRYVIPTFIALTANSPFWKERLTTYASNRLRVYKRVLTMGLPPVVENWAKFFRWMRKNSKFSVLEERDIYWDARPRKELKTLEVRFVDMPYSLEQTLETACLILGTIGATISVGGCWLNRYVCSEAELKRNRAVAIHKGMSGAFTFFGKEVTAYDSVLSLLEALDDFKFKNRDVQSAIKLITHEIKKGQTYKWQVINTWRKKGNDFKDLVESLCAFVSC